MKTLLVILALPATLLLTSQTAGAHCQVPCGIYDDHARIHAMKEDVTTIAKAVKLIGELAEKSDAVSKNQLNRWIQTKEIHASRIITTVSEYFLTQKIKPPTKKSKQAWAAYVARLVACHKVMRSAMKAKQTVDKHVVKNLAVNLDALGDFYPPAK